MKTHTGVFGLGLLLAAALGSGVTVRAQSGDPGWPRVFKQNDKQLTVYQPQVDYWRGYTNLHFRCAIAVRGVLKEEKFGVAEVDALTVTDPTTRTVAIAPIKRELRFGNVQEPQLTQLRQAVAQLHPPEQAITLSMDRLIAYLHPTTQPVQKAVDVNLNPPKIFSSSTPAILVIFMGEPKLEPVETNRTDLLFALNTNWDVLYDVATQRYYLLNGEGWLTTPDLFKGPWTPATTLPSSLYTLPPNANWAEARSHLPGKAPKLAPTVFATTEPAEMILTDGPITYRPIPTTRLLQVNNTASVLFLDTADGKLYFLVAGRWFRASSLQGPWSAASANLPADFAQIPANDPAAFVKACVPGTREASDAVLLASIPTTTAVNLTNVPLNVTYAGQPQFVPITDTTVQYAVNTPSQVLLVNGTYYCCDQGVWLVSSAATGPWTFCTTVPAVIYTIPPSCPVYNVTYVRVETVTPTTVVYAQTAGYSGEYVAATGVLMFGAGVAVGALLAGNSSYYYCPPHACFYSYGCGATYHYGYGGYYCRGGGAYGPYGGAGYSASYNSASGTYSRSSYAYGPYGSASRTASYNPYTGGYAANTHVNTPYGSANRSVAYNPSTGARAAGGQVSTPYGSAGRAAAYNPATGQGAAGGYRSGAYGSAGAATSTRGGSAAAWDTQQGKGAVGKTASGDVYASNGDTVYKRNSNGSWQENSGSGWQNTSKPQPQSTGYAQPRTASTSSSGAQERQSMESQAQARSWGNQQHEAARSWGGGARSYGGGSRGRR
jgi:hypothetical protein